MRISVAQQGQTAFAVDRSGVLLLALASIVGLAVLFVVLSWQQHTATPADRAPTVAATHGNSEGGASWARLDDSQRAMLLPLRQTWSELDLPARQRWLRIVARLRGLDTQTNARAHARMAEWAKLSPQKRAAARLRYVHAEHVPAAKRQQLWSVYQRLPKGVLRSAPVSPGLTVVAPVVVHVGPGATTILMTKLPAS